MDKINGTLASSDALESDASPGNPEFKQILLPDRDFS
jgi:hypothetical protein